jgi:hypothetical protein
MVVYTREFTEHGGPAEELPREIWAEPSICVRLHGRSEQASLLRVPVNLPLADFAEGLLAATATQGGAGRVRLRRVSDKDWLDRDRSLREQGITDADRDNPVDLYGSWTLLVEVQDAEGGPLAAPQVVELLSLVSDLAHSVRENLSSDTSDQGVEWRLYDPVELRWLDEGASLAEALRTHVEEPVTLQLHSGGPIPVWLPRHTLLHPFLSRAHTVKELVDQLTSARPNALDAPVRYGVCKEGDLLPLLPEGPLWEQLQGKPQVDLQLVPVYEVSLKRTDEDRRERIHVLPDQPIMEWFDAWAQMRMRETWEKYRQSFTARCGRHEFDWRRAESRSMHSLTSLSICDGAEFEYGADILINLQVADCSAPSQDVRIPIYETWDRLLSVWTQGEPPLFLLPANASAWRVWRQKTDIWLALDQPCGNQGVETGETLYLQPVTTAYVVDLSQGPLGRVLRLTIPTNVDLTSADLLRAVSANWSLPKPSDHYRLVVLDPYTLMRLGAGYPFLIPDESVLTEGTNAGLLVLGMCEYAESDELVTAAVVREDLPHHPVTEHGRVQ